MFRSTFVGIIAGKNASVLENWLYSWINSGVQLVGYYFAALSVDFKPWGRRRMTVFSFFMVSALTIARCSLCMPACSQESCTRFCQWTPSDICMSLLGTDGFNRQGSLQPSNIGFACKAS